MSYTGGIASFEGRARHGIALRPKSCLACIGRRFPSCRKRQISSALGDGRNKVESGVFCSEIRILTPRDRPSFMCELPFKNSSYQRNAWLMRQSVKFALFRSTHYLENMPSIRSEYMQRRGVRTGFFRGDSDFNDPERALFAEPANEWAHADGGGALDEAVLERNNVGMGLCILNSNALTSGTVFSLYRRLRDLEVNSLKRVVCVTSRTRERFSTGFSDSELLSAAELSQTDGGILPAFALWLFHNAWELHATVHSYSKPLISLLNGQAAYGWIPTLGLSHVLGRLRGSLGAFLALTGHEVKAQDLIWTGLCRYWMSPEALHFLELTCEKQLEVSEQDAKALIEEHFLEPPKSYTLDMWEEIIDFHFDRPSVPDVLSALDTTARGATFDSFSGRVLGASRICKWASLVASRIRQRSPLANELTFELIRRQKQLQSTILKEANISPHEWRKIKAMDAILPSNIKDDSMKQILEAVDERLLEQALQNEMRVALRLIAGSRDLVEGLRMRITSDVPDISRSAKWTDVSGCGIEEYFDALPVPSVKCSQPTEPTQTSIQVRRDPLNLFSSADFVPAERSLFPFSSNPLTGRMAPGGAGAGLSERQQVRLLLRWNWAFYQKILMREMEMRTKRDQM